MLVDTYMCRECFEPQVFKPEERNKKHICPKCGGELEFWVTEDIDPTTNKVKESSFDNEKLIPDEITSPTIYDNILTKPVVVCPYCQSKDVKKISGTSRTVSTFLFGLGSKKIGKQWHCNNCKSDF